MVWVVVAIVAALLVIGAVVTYRVTRSNDAVESFRRQIDALSPEARRNVVDQVNRIDESGSEASDSIAADAPAGEDPTGDPPGDDPRHDPRDDADGDRDA